MLFHIGQVLLLSYVKSALSLLQSTLPQYQEDRMVVFCFVLFFLAGVTTNDSMEKVLFAWNAERQKKV